MVFILVDRLSTTLEVEKTFNALDKLFSCSLMWRTHFHRELFTAPCLLCLDRCLEKLFVQQFDRRCEQKYEHLVAQMYLQGKCAIGITWLQLMQVVEITGLFLNDGISTGRAKD